MTLNQIARQVNASDRRLLQTGLPLAMASTVLWTLPVLGRHYLDDLGYSRWALVMTVVVSAPIFDLGGSILIQSIGYAKAVPQSVAWHARLLSGVGASLVTALAFLLASVVRTSSSVATRGAGDLRLLLLLTGLASVVRSLWTVEMALLQTLERFGVRAGGAALQAFSQVVVCWLMLVRDDGVWALPFSLLFSSLLALAFGRLVGKEKRSGPQEVGAPTNERRSLAASRVVSALAGVVASQGDRWVLAAIATPSLLSKYDFALRMASVPLGLTVTLFQGVTSESAHRKSPGQRRSLLVGAIKQITMVVIAMSVLTLAGLVVLWQLHLLSVDLTVVGFTGLALVWMGANAVTAAPTFTYLGAGRPWAELSYSVPCAVTLMAGWGVVALLQSPLMLPAASTLAIVGWSLWFVRRSLLDRQL